MGHFNNVTVSLFMFLFSHFWTVGFEVQWRWILFHRLIDKTHHGATTGMCVKRIVICKWSSSCFATQQNAYIYLINASITPIPTLMMIIFRKVTVTTCSGNDGGGGSGSSNSSSSITFTNCILYVSDIAKVWYTLTWWWPFDSDDVSS